MDVGMSAAGASGDGQGGSGAVTALYACIIYSRI